MVIRFPEPLSHLLSPADSLSAPLPLLLLVLLLVVPVGRRRLVRQLVKVSPHYCCVREGGCQREQLIVDVVVVCVCVCVCVCLLCVCVCGVIVA